MAYSDEVLADSPGLYWRMDDTSGTTCTDSSGNGLNGTYEAVSGTGYPLLNQTGAITGSPGILMGDGTNTGTAWRADAAAIDIADVFTLECWIKNAVSPTGDQTLIDKGQDAGHIRLTGSTFQLLQSNVKQIVSATVAISDTTTWHHVVATKNGATVKLYIDGVDVTGSVDNGTCSSNNEAITTGVRVSGSDTYRGYMDEVAVYTTALSAARVLAHYEAASGAGTDATVALTGFRASGTAGVVAPPRPRPAHPYSEINLRM